MPVDKGHPEAGFIEVEPLAIAAIDLVWVIVALAALMLLFAAWVLFSVLKAMFGSVSVFGFVVFDITAALLQKAMKNVAGLLDQRVKAFGEFIWSIVQTVWRVVYVLGDTIAVLAGRILDNAVWAQQQVQTEQNRAITAENALRAQFEAELGTDEKALNLLEQAVNTTVQDTLPTLQAELDNLEARVNGLSGQPSAATLADLTALRNQLEQELSQNVTNLQAGIQHAEDLAQQEIGQATTNLQGQIANGVTTAEAFATGAAAGAETGAVAQVLAQLQPQLNAIETDIGECLDPLCDTVTPNASQLGNLGKLLKDLEGLFGAFALTGLLVAAVEDPKGTADALVDVCGWMTNAGVELVDVIGEAAGVQL